MEVLMGMGARARTVSADERPGSYSTVCGVIGGLGPSATAQFYNNYILEGRRKLFEAMSNIDEDPEGALDKVRKVSSARWTLSEIRQVSSHTAGRTKLVDQDHIPIILYGNSQVPGRPAFILGESSVDPTPQLAHTARALTEGGANMLCMTCNTAHYFLPRIKASLGKYVEKANMPLFLDMLELTIKSISNLDIGDHNGVIPVGLLATRATVETGIYQDAAKRVLEAHPGGVKIEIVTPDSIAAEDGGSNPHGGSQDSIEEAIFGEKGLKAGFVDTHPKSYNVSLILQQVRALKNYGAKAIILGCTELPLVLDEDSEAAKAAGVHIVNPGKVLGDEVLRLCLLSRDAPSH